MKTLSARAPFWSALLLSVLPLAAAPIFSDAFVPVKWAAAYALVTALFAGAWLGKGDLACWAPGGLQRYVWYAFAVCWLPSGWQLLRRDPAALTVVVAPWLLALLLASTAWTRDPEAFVRGLRRWNLLTLAVVVTLGVAQWAGWDPFPSLLAGSGPEGFSGNPNFQGEYLGLAILIDLSLSSRAPLPSRLERVRWGLLALAFVFILVLRCRAVLLALCVTGAWAALRGSAWKSRSCAAMAGAIALLILLTSIKITIWIPDHWGPRKSAGVEQRIARWWNTAAMAAAQPWFGHGFGTYASEYPRFHAARMADAGSSELSRVTHAHDDWLELAAESGFPAAIAGLLFFAPFTAGFPPFTFLLVDSVFAFPFHHPVPVFAIALLIPVFFPRGVRPLTSPMRVASLGLLLGAAISGTIYAGAKWSEARLDRNERNLAWFHSACRAMPTVAENCVVEAQLGLAAGRTAEAIQQLREVLSNQPFEPNAIRWLTFAQFDSGQTASACATLRGYRDVYGEANSAGEVYHRLCSGEPARAEL